MAAAMKNWGSAAFPIAVLGTLAGLSFWLVGATSFEDEVKDGKNRHDPDYIIRGMELSRLDKTGRLQYILNADDVVHYPDDDSTDVTKPHLVYLHPTKPTLTLSALTAQISSEGETVHLQDDVRIKRDPTATREALYGTMPDLTILTNEETANTESPVRFTQGKSWLTGVGMHLDNKTQTYVLKSRAVGEFESRKAKAQ